MLNPRALRIADRLRNDRDGYGVDVHDIAGATVIDGGVKARGGWRAGVEIARVCLADLADVTLTPGEFGLPLVQVTTDRPVLACMASQYAGWQISVGKYFAMGSGPMRAVYGKEKLFDEIPGRERAPHAVGVLETGKLPPLEVIEHLAGKLDLTPQAITLLAAATRSPAGSLQVVARALEMALHKLHELHFNLDQILSGTAFAPLPPPAVDDLAAIGRTNDAILYGGRATVLVDADDDQLAELGPRVPACASPEFGALFADLFAKYQDFYKIDPMLFSPAEIVFCNRRSGRVHRFGRMDADILRRSFGL